MTTASLSRRLLVALAIVVLALAGLALPAAAKGGHKSGPKARPHQTTDVAGHGQRGRSAGAKARRTEAHARRQARFVAAGFVTAVDTDTVTVDVKGGKKALRRLSQADGGVVFTVTEDTRIKLDGKRLTADDLDLLEAGDHVVVKGRANEDGDLVARKLFAQSPEDDVDATDDVDGSNDLDATTDETTDGGDEGDGDADSDGTGEDTGSEDTGSEGTGSEDTATV